MALGQLVRGLFGRHEHAVADLYRSVFVNLEDYAAMIGKWVPDAGRILEVGCGEGAVTEKLAEIYPAADILAIDITPRAGRLYRGRTTNVRFMTTTVQDIAEDCPGQFDLIVLSDVIHHVPVDLRVSILDAIGKALAPGGHFILKDWSPAGSPIHWLCHASDRWITGDQVSHLLPEEARSLVENTIPPVTTLAVGHVRPWKNNFAFLFRG